MRNPEIELRGIGTDSRRFAAQLSSAKLFTRGQDGEPLVAADLGQVTVDFTGLGADDGLKVEDVATIALAIRAVAESGRSVRVLLPRQKSGRPSRISRFLERLGFRALFDSDTVRDQWTAHVSIIGYRQQGIFIQTGAERTNYIPLRWFSKQDFDFDQNVSLWRAHPRLRANVERQFRSVLLVQGFADLETIDLLTKTMFLELCWNTILHSSKAPGNGIGVFGGQIGVRVNKATKTREPEITFCVADLGRGIPRALGTVYKADPDWSGYHARNSVSENSGIVRFALDSRSTSRPELPSDVDRAGFRGLAYVASALQGRGEMLIRSDGGAVALVGQAEGTRARPTDRFRTNPIIGTQILGRLRKKTLPREVPTLRVPRTLPPPTSINLVCDFDGRCSALATAKAADAFASRVQAIEATLILDLGYADSDARSLEYLCKTVIPLHPNKRFIFWNVTIPWTHLLGLDDWLQELCRDRLFPPLFVRGNRDARFLGAGNILQPGRWSEDHGWLRQLLEEAIARTREETKSVGRAAFLTPEEFIRLTNDINSHFLTKGFETSDFARSRDSGDSNNGFFTGSIHLLRGGPPVSRYFSLTTHVDCLSDANLRRWSEACATAVTCLLAGAKADDQKLVLVGFTGTMREVVARAYMKLRRKCRAYMLLTFDIPTKEEIASKLQPGDQVVLVTDVVSTGTLVQAVWNLVRRVGANVLGIASLVDARRVTASAETFMTFAGEEVRLVTASQLHAPARSQFELTDVEYWVDPVSLVPRPTKTWGWVPDLDTKIEKTIDMINDSQACSCGHVVDGTRHASVYVDLQKLLEVQDIAAQEQIAEVCRERLTRRGWKDFSPGIVLFPSGIARIESVAFESGPRETPVSSELVTVYHTAVRTYVERLRRIWPQMTLIEVQRAFDPGGGSPRVFP